MTDQIGPFSTPAFIIKLYDILEDQNSELYSHIITWSEDGEYFIVLQPKLLEQEILLQYFKHNHYQSFLRQLNMYEFLKARNSENNEVFSHPYFKRKQKKLLSLIKRYPIKNKNKHKHKIIKQEHKKSDLQQQVDTELLFLKQRQFKFEQQFTEITQQNEIIMEQHRQIWGELGQSKKLLDVKIDRLSYLLSFILQQNDQNSIQSSNLKAEQLDQQFQTKMETIKTEQDPLSLRILQSQLNWNMKIPMNMPNFSPNRFQNEQQQQQSKTKFLFCLFPIGSQELRKWRKQFLKLQLNILVIQRRMMNFISLIFLKISFFIVESNTFLKNTFHR